MRKRRLFCLFSPSVHTQTLIQRFRNSPLSPKTETFENGFESGDFQKWRLSKTLRCRVDGRKRRLLKTVSDPVCKVEQVGKMADKRLIIIIFILQLISSWSASFQLHLAVLNLQKQYVRRTLNITRLLVFTSSNTRVKRLSPEKSKASLFAFFTADVSFSFLFAFDMLNYTITFGAWNLRANCRHVKSYCRLSLFQHAHYTNHWSKHFFYRCRVDGWMRYKNERVDANILIRFQLNENALIWKRIRVDVA